MSWIPKTIYYVKSIIMLIYDLVATLCTEDNGRPDIGPVLLIKFYIVQ